MTIAKDVVLKGYEFKEVGMNGEFLSFVSAEGVDTYAGIDVAIENQPTVYSGVICWFDSLFVRFGVQVDGKLQAITAEAFNSLGAIQVVPTLVDGVIRHMKISAVMELLEEHAPNLCVTTRYTIGTKGGRAV